VVTRIMKFHCICATVWCSSRVLGVHRGIRAQLSELDSWSLPRRSTSHFV